MCVLLNTLIVNNILILDIKDITVNRLNLVDGRAYFNARSLLEGDVESPIVGFFTRDIYKGIKRYIKFTINETGEEIVLNLREIK